MTSFFSKPTVFRTGVYGIAIKNQKLLLVKQNKGPHLGKWELPGGGIEGGETIEGALRREFHEEVGMTFDSMELFRNVTAITDAVDQKGNSYCFHQVGLLYLVDGLSQLHPPQTEDTWIDLEHVKQERMSPFVAQAIRYLKRS